MKAADGDQAVINPLIAETHRLRSSVDDLRPGYELVQRINQTGGFNRGKADRVMNLSDLSDLEKQRAQIERDLINVEWLGDASRELARMLEVAIGAIDGGTKAVNHELRQEKILPKGLTAGVVYFDSAECGSRDALSVVVRRLRETTCVSKVCVLTDDPDEARDRLGGLADAVRVEAVDLGAYRARRDRARTARRWCPGAWRGGLGGATVYDELFEPESLLGLMGSLDADTALVAGADWVDLDVELAGRVVRRQIESEGDSPLAFSQAACGLSPIALSRGVVGEFARAANDRAPWATVGGLLGYMPFNPLADPIAKSLCVAVAPELRDRAVLSDKQPSHVILEVSGERVDDQGASGAWRPDRSGIDLLGADDWKRVLDGIAKRFDLPALTFAGSGDPLTHSHVAAVVRHAVELGFAVHVRTSPLHDTERLEEIAGLADVLSLDVLAHSASVFRELTGIDAFGRVVSTIESLLEGRDLAHGWPRRWVVPRMTRCYAVRDEIPSFYDLWLMRAGAAVIDPLPREGLGDRFDPLPLPALARRLQVEQTLAIRCDGMVVTGGTDAVLGEPIGASDESDFSALWERLRSRRRDDETSS